METIGLLVRMEAKSGKEEELEAFLKSALALAEAETGTISWYAIKMSDTMFGIFDTFETNTDRRTHLDGPIAAALMENASVLLAKPPVIESIDIIAVK